MLSLAGKPTTWEAKTRLFDELSSDEPITLREVIACDLGSFDVDAQRDVAPLGAQPVDDGLQQRGLAGLPGRVQDEVFLLVDELPKLGPVDACEGVDAIVLSRVTGTCSVEMSNDGIPPWVIFISRPS